MPLSPLLPTTAPPTPYTNNFTFHPGRNMLDVFPQRHPQPTASRRRRRHRGSSRSSTSSFTTVVAAARDLLVDAPTPRTFSTLFKTASSSSPSLSSPSLGAQLHAQAILRGFLAEENTILATAIINFYVSCREPDLARLVFDAMADRNVITWNSLIKGYAQVGRREEALKLFRNMKRQGHVVPDKYTFPALLSHVGRKDEGGCMQELGGAVHAHVIKVGLEKDPFVGASLISMYAAIEMLVDVKVAFDDIDSLDPVVWSSMISAYVNCNEEEEALRMFHMMLCLGIKPTCFVYSILFMLCGSISMLEMGRQLHAHSLKNNSDTDVAMENALLTMYSDCGCIHDARKVFSSIDNTNIISCNSMISALAQHGYLKEVVDLFRQMKLAGPVPDEVTLLNLLSAFNHAGLVHEGLQIFTSMEEVEGVKPAYQHYACVVDMLARSGEIGEAMNIINKMPFEAGTSLWRIVLGACSKHCDIVVGKQVAEMLLEIEPCEAMNYILLGNIYARLGRWAEAKNVRNAMEERFVDKEDAFSWIELGQRTHRFRVYDHSHPLSGEIYRNLNRLISRIKIAGYVPDISFAAHNIERERREESLYYHCEKLAFAFGDLAAPSGDTLRIMKNLRVCGDCHCAYKYFSLITGREIILRDNHRFHHFNKGTCSCGDYW